MLAIEWAIATVGITLKIFAVDKFQILSLLGTNARPIDVFTFCRRPKLYCGHNFLCLKQTPLQSWHLVFICLGWKRQSLFLCFVVNIEDREKGKGHKEARLKTRNEEL